MIRPWKFPLSSMFHELSDKILVVPWTLSCLPRSDPCADLQKQKNENKSSSFSHSLAFRCLSWHYTNKSQSRRSGMQFVIECENIETKSFDDDPTLHERILVRADVSGDIRQLQESIRTSKILASPRDTIQFQNQGCSITNLNSSSLSRARGRTDHRHTDWQEQQQGTRPMEQMP